MSRRWHPAVAVFLSLFLLPLIVIGSLGIAGTHYVSKLFLKERPDSFQAVVNYTKTQFIVLLSFVLWAISPANFTVTYDKSIPEDFQIGPDGLLTSVLEQNSVLISNHQIYTDWLFHWYLAYSARLSDSICIILKDMSNIPILGYGMKNFNFLFLSRKWEKDKVVLTNQLLQIDANARGLGPANNVKHVASTNLRISPSTPDVRSWPEGQNASKSWPYQIILYPEGTVPSEHTVARSQEYTTKRGLKPLKHVLLPRVRGLFLTLRKLRNSIQVVYDVTTGYSDLKESEYGEIKFSLKRTFILGRGPPKANLYVQPWRISDIPLGEETLDIDDAKPEDLEKFEEWLLKIWYEKDKALDRFYKTGKFTEPGDNLTTVVTEVKLKNLFEIVTVFYPVFIVLLLLRVIWIGVSKLLP